MLHTVLSLPVISCLLAAFGVYWLFRGRRAPAESIEQRLDKLDRSLASMRALVLIFFLATVLLGNLLVHSLTKAIWWEAQFRSLKAEELVLMGRGDEGPYRATLRTDWDAVRFNLHDKEGKNRVALAITAEGIPSVAVLDTNEKPRGYIGVTDEVTAFLINDQNGKPGAGFTLAKDGTMTLGRFVDGKKPAVTMTFAREMPILSLHDQSGKGGLFLMTNVAEKRTSLTCYDHKGVKRLEIGLVDGVPVINTFDADGKPIPTKP